MPCFVINGGFPLHGEVQVQGAKNAVLPIMAASILNCGITVLTHVPRITDVADMKEILEYLGCRVDWYGDVLVIDAKCLDSCEIPGYLGQKMRSSIMLLGALLGRTGEAATYHPGGCSIGARPVDLHCRVLEALGAEMNVEDGRIFARAKRLRGGEIYLPFPSVGATENAVLAAVCAEGVSVIRGCAREPEIVQLCIFLNQMGAEIAGIGTGRLIISGRSCLHDTCYCVEGDRIAAATYLYAAAACTGKVTVNGVCPEYLISPLKALEKMGCCVETSRCAVRVGLTGRLKPLCEVRTEVYPGFPTDLQSPMLTLMSLAEGKSVMQEDIFEGRFRTAQELVKMGADIVIEGNRAVVAGRGGLQGCEVTARDLRCGAALVIAGLAAEGTTVVSDCRHILRGYEDLPGQFRLLGGQIEEEIQET